MRGSSCAETPTRAATGVVRVVEAGAHERVEDRPATIPVASAARPRSSASPAARVRRAHRPRARRPPPPWRTSRPSSLRDGARGRRSSDRRRGRPAGARRAADLSRALAAREVAQQREPLAGCTPPSRSAPRPRPRARSHRCAARRARQAWPASQTRDGCADARDLVVVLDRAQQPQRERVGSHGLDTRPRAARRPRPPRDRSTRARRAPHAGPANADRAGPSVKPSYVMISQLLPASACPSSSLTIADDGSVARARRRAAARRTDSAPTSRPRRSR